MTSPQANRETEAIRYLIHQRLKARLPPEPPSSGHLDEDTISAFVEGRLEESESSPVISHLIACTSCRQTTAQLIRLEANFDSGSEPTALDDDPGRMPSLLERLTARLTPSFEEDAVFAYQDPSSESEDGADVGSKPKRPEDAE